MAKTSAPSNPIQTNTKITDEELLRLPPQEIIKLYRRLEAENFKLWLDHGALAKELNRNMQAHMLEVKGLKEDARRLKKDNQELREVCCFLDDDRQVAQEWMLFGQHTARVMEKEVAAYRAKLQVLEAKQRELVRDNLELKELCLYLDDERSRVTCPQCGSPAVGRRDEGDGSSSSDSIPAPPPQSVINEQVLRYIKRLEKHFQTKDKQEQLLSRPAAVIQAMKVLEVRDQLENCPPTDSSKESLEEGERALVREMCNVVWRKLEEPPLD